MFHTQHPHTEVVMEYIETLNQVDAGKALKALGVDFTLQGAYFHIPCPACGMTAVLKAYGEKKNLIYCPKCKASSHIIKLTMGKLETDWEGAKKFLKDKAIPFTFKRLDKPLTFSYELVYHALLRQKGLSEEFCKDHGIGYPKGKTMLAGCITFEIFNEDATRIAYYGIRIKDGRHVFHNTFNPEFYLYGMYIADPGSHVHFTTDMYRCLELQSQGYNCVCNFGLPYLSEMHCLLLQRCEYVIYHKDENFSEIMKQAVKLNHFMQFLD